MNIRNSVAKWILGKYSFLGRDNGKSYLSDFSESYQNFADVIFLNTGYAQVLGFEGSIIMGKEDMLRAYQMMPQARIVGIHMDTVNHAMLTRAELRAFIKEKKMDTRRALVPEDGEAYSF